jgi:hypothetical protein
VLVPFVVIGALHRRRSPDFRPWFVYTAVVFAGATLLYPLHVPGGAFIHTAIGLAPHAAILGVEGILVLVSWLSSRRRRWDESRAGSIFVWGMVAIVAAIAVAFALPVQHQWDTVRQPRAALAASLDGLGVTAEDRIFSIDAAGLTYWTGRPGVVTTNDSLATEEAIARAYGLRWLVLERAETATSMGPVLAGNRPPWVGPPGFVVPSSDGGDPQLALYPICLDAAVQRCAAK